MKITTTLSLLFISNLAIADVYNVIITKEHSKYEENLIIPIVPIVAESCKEILDSGTSVGSGNYTLLKDSNTFDVYCDMVTDGGGWTLVLSDSLGQNSWDQFTQNQSGIPLQENYRSSIHTTSINFTDILWYNHPNDEWTSFENRTSLSARLNQILNYENDAYTYKAVSGVMKTTDSYYNLITCPSWTGMASPILMLSGSDEHGDDFGGSSTGKRCDSWERDYGSWYYRFNGGSFSGNPWRENGHQIDVITPKLQSFFVR